MKKSVMVFIIFVLFLMTVHSVFAEEIFSDYIEEDASETIDGILYTVYQYNEYTGARISSNRYGSIILEEVGSSSTAGPYTFTLDEILEENNTASFKITVAKQASSVTVTRELSNSSATVGDTLTMTITITNEGENNADVTYTEDMPQGIDILTTPEVKKGSSTVTQKSSTHDVSYNGVLYSDESVVITFEIRVTGYPEDGSIISFDNAFFSYEDTGETNTGSVDELTVTLQDPVTVTFTSDADTISIGQEVMYMIIVRNNLAEQLDISSFVLELPHIPITSMDTYLTEDSSGYTWSGQMGAYEDKIFTFYVRPENPGTYSFGASATYDYNGEQTATDTVAFSIEAAEIVPEIILSSATFDGNEPIIIYYYVNNSDPEISYSNVNITLSSDPSDLFQKIHYVTALPANSKILIKKQNFTTPFSDTDMSYMLRMEGTLDTGETFEATKAIAINAADFTSPYAVAYTVDSVDNENANVTMTLTLLTTMALQPSSLAIVHTADPDYKKTVSLTTDQIGELFTTQTFTRSWSIPLTSFTEDSVSINVQLQYTDSSGTYYDVQDSVTLTLSQNIVQESVPEEIPEEIPEKTEEVAEIVEPVPTEVEPTSTDEELSISGQQEQESQKWVWFFVILGVLIGFGITFTYLMKTKKKKAEIKKNIRNLSGKKEEEKESIFSRAKEIVIQEVPNPDEGYEKLESYIKHSLSMGKSDEEIKKILVGKGWIEDVLESYVRRLK